MAKTDKDWREFNADEALEAAKRSPHSMVIVLWKDGPGAQIKCMPFTSFFMYDDMDLALGLVAQSITKLRAEQGTDTPEPPAELQRPAQPTIFRGGAPGGKEG